jgi:hypothetical protein
MTVIPIYAALLAFVFVALSVRVIRVRRAVKVAIGSSGNARLERAMRVQANFAEYTPFALILLLMLELNEANSVILHGLGAALLIGRCIHAYGLAGDPEDFRFRVTGMATTLTTILLAATLLLWLAI